MCMTGPVPGAAVACIHKRHLTSGLNRGSQLRIHRVAAVVMRYLNYLTRRGRGHNGPTSMYIDVVGCMCKQSAMVNNALYIVAFGMAAAAWHMPNAYVRYANACHMRGGMIPPNPMNMTNLRVTSAARF